MLKTDCSFFPGDRPCKYHKESGIKCDNCTYYLPIESKILIIKLDAIGDVLRTTSILRPLKEKYPGAYITWCTRKESKDLFINNNLVDSVIIINDDAMYRLSVENFDLIINLDTSKISSAIASTTNCKNKIGFILNEKGSVIPTSNSAMEWLQMSAFDDVKKANKKTYQHIMYEICDLNLPVQRPILNIANNNTDSLKNKYGINNQKFTLGLNTGVGNRWPNKGWPLERWEELIQLLKQEDFNLLLLGGPEEREKNSFLIEKFNFLVDTGCDNSILDFSSIVNICDLLITADTFALHIGTALDKFVIAMFGPTSVSEIELYGKGTKLTGTKECRCFYQRSCKEAESCMTSINANILYQKILGFAEKYNSSEL
jgi:ADP-heptose:LPS heptosyltransferase